MANPSPVSQVIAQTTRLGTNASSANARTSPPIASSPSPPTTSLIVAIPATIHIVTDGCRDGDHERQGEHGRRSAGADRRRDPRPHGAGQLAPGRRLGTGQEPGAESGRGHGTTADERAGETETVDAAEQGHHDGHQDIRGDARSVPGPRRQPGPARRGVAGEQRQERHAQRHDGHRDRADDDRYTVPEQPDRRSDADGPEPPDAVVGRVCRRGDIRRDRREHEDEHRQQSRLQRREHARDPSGRTVERAAERVGACWATSPAGPRTGAVENTAGDAHGAMVAARRAGAANPTRRVGARNGADPTWRSGYAEGAGPSSGRGASGCCWTGGAAQARSWRASAAVSDGVLPTLTPAASRASFFACAVPDEPETMAPAWPMVLPSGAVKPAT